MMERGTALLPRQAALRTCVCVDAHRQVRKACLRGSACLVPAGAGLVAGLSARPRAQLGAEPSSLENQTQPSDLSCVRSRGAMLCTQRQALPCLQVVHRFAPLARWKLAARIPDTYHRLRSHAQARRPPGPRQARTCGAAWRASTCWPRRRPPSSSSTARRCGALARAHCAERGSALCPLVSPALACSALLAPALHAVCMAVPGR